MLLWPNKELFVFFVYYNVWMLISTHAKPEIEIPTWSPIFWAPRVFLQWSSPLPKQEMSYWKRGVSSRFFSFMLAAWNIEQRCLLANALYRTVATSQIPEKEFLCMRQRADLKCRSGKSSYQCIAHTSTLRGVLRFVPCISRPIASRDGGTNRDS